MASIISRTLSAVSSNIMACFESSSSLFKTMSLASYGCQQTQVRGRYVDWRMRRDAKRRTMIKEQFPERLRLNALRKNNILPKELQELADVEIHALPRDSSIVRVRNRCVVTSRPRGIQRKWRVSRIVWRQLADYNKMSGVIRSCW